VLPCEPSVHIARNVRRYKVRKLLGRLKEYLHQTYCQQDVFVLGEKLDVRKGGDDLEGRDVCCSAV